MSGHINNKHALLTMTGIVVIGVMVTIGQITAMKLSEDTGNGYADGTCRVMNRTVTTGETIPLFITLHTA